MADRELEQIVQEAFRQSAGGLLEGVPVPDLAVSLTAPEGTPRQGTAEVVEAILRNTLQSGESLGTGLQAVNLTNVETPRPTGPGQESEAPRSGDELAERLGETTRQVSGLAQVGQTLADIVWANTQALLRPPVAGVASSGGVTRNAGSAALSFLTSGFGLSPLVTSLASLFRRGDREEAAAPLIRYALPPPVRFDAINSREGGNSPFGFAAVDYGAGPQPRAIQIQTETVRAAAPVNPVPQITIQVQAMDSRSFLDHSDDIARAVRDAMLNIHPLNDVIQDL
ncbi:MAG: hypothetical protein IPM24_24705 [Bryobacterales bacterium]|nr:hypothetical protein [Bryobacterales bacterium]